MLTWSSEYETGVQSIDSDHRQLVRSLNELEKAIAEGQGSARIGSLLSFLEKYAAEHFTREEACMHRHQCPVAAVNKAAHGQFLAKFEAARQRVAQAPAAGALVAIQTHRELCDWMVNHILRVDLNIKGCVRSGA